MARKKKEQTATEAKPFSPANAGAYAVPAAFKTIGTSLVDYALHQRYGYFHGPDADSLEKYEIAFRNDPYIHAALNYIVSTLIAGLGPYVHKDPRAVRYVEEMRSRMSSSLEQQLGELVISGLWSGFGVSEKIFKYENGKVWLVALQNYHPRSISIVPNEQGQMIENEEISVAVNKFPVSGLWQELPGRMLREDPLPGTKRLRWMNYVRLPLNKVVFVGHNRRHGNWAGESALAPIWLRYQTAMETIQNLVITSERFGAPLVAAIVPASFTSEQVDLGNGDFRYKTTGEAAREALGQMNVSTAMVFEEPLNVGNNEKTRIQTLSSFNNFGESFLSTLRTWYSDLLLGLGIPPLLFVEHSGGLGAGAIAAVHAETYKQTLNRLHKEFIEPFCEQVIGQLLKINFDIDDPGHFVFNPFDIVAASNLMNSFAEANKNGLLDFSVAEDLKWARAAMGWPMPTEDTMPERLKNNKKLMDNIRNPEAEKTKQLNAKNNTAVETANINASALQENNKRLVNTQRYVANLKAKTDAEKPKPKKSPPKNNT